MSALPQEVEEWFNFTHDQLEPMRHRELGCKAHASSLQRKIRDVMDELRAGEMSGEDACRQLIAQTHKGSLPHGAAGMAASVFNLVLEIAPLLGVSDRRLEELGVF